MRESMNDEASLFIGREVNCFSGLLEEEGEYEHDLMREHEELASERKTKDEGQIR